MIDYIECQLGRMRWTIVPVHGNAKERVNQMSLRQSHLNDRKIVNIIIQMKTEYFQTNGQQL